MRIAAVQAWFPAVPVGRELFDRDRALAEPESALLGLRGKDDVSGPLDLLAKRRERWIALEAGGAVVAAGSDRDQDVLLDPRVPFPFRAQLVGVHLELVGATCEGRGIVGDRLVVSLTEANQV
ncbi:hypothetical protein Q2941_37490 [Bradyrhizobium sp. UFLA05-153]